MLKTTFFPSGLYWYIVEHLWAFLCRGVSYVNQELKISVFCWFNYAGLHNNSVSPYTLAFQISYTVAAKLNYWIALLYNECTVMLLAKLDGPQTFYIV